MFDLTQQMIYNINVNVGVGFLGSQIFYKKSIKNKVKKYIICIPITLNNPMKALNISTSY